MTRNRHQTALLNNIIEKHLKDFLANGVFNCTYIKKMLERAYRNIPDCGSVVLIILVIDCGGPTFRALLSNDSAKAVQYLLRFASSLMDYLSHDLGCTTKYQLHFFLDGAAEAQKAETQE